jgi:ATP-dependent phosphofructokinase / diphosphate-dependent phosphofructokinase
MSSEQGSIGILVGGGPAPGLNGVIAAVTIAAKRKDLKVYGFYEGYKYLVQPDEKLFRENAIELQINDISRIHFDGGSILKTSRTSPAKTPGGVENSVKNLKALGIKYMVTVGGDDTAYGASEIAKAAAGEIKFAHVPKTIDNDLPLPEDIPTFGYNTARDLGSQLIKNLMEDARTTGRWYIVVMMGRHAGHLTMGTAKSAGATLAIIAEEFGLEGTITLANICDVFEGAVLKRRAMGNNHGVMVIAEGVVERMAEEELKSVPNVSLEYDGFGHLRMSEVPFGKIVQQEMKKRFKDRDDSIPLVELDLGYVLRCADPIPFDQEYTRDLGYNAVKYLVSDKPEHQKDAMICVKGGALHPLYFEDMLDPKTKKTQVRFVDVNSDSFQTARSYMVRLEKKDIDSSEMLTKLAKEAKMTKDEFVKKFGYMFE